MIKTLNREGQFQGLFVVESWIDLGGVGAAEVGFGFFSDFNEDGVLDAAQEFHMGAVDLVGSEDNPGKCVPMLM